jgi:hypothetical protein
MMRLRNWLSYGNITATVAVFLAISGTAAAVTLAPKNSVISPSIQDGEVRTPDLHGGAVTAAKLGANSVGSGKVTDGSLTGADVRDDTIGERDIRNGSLFGTDIADGSISHFEVAPDTLGGAEIQESSLGQVPAATLGGLGRYGFDGGCDPESEDFDPCSAVSVDLPNPARMLVIGTVNGHVEGESNHGLGSCRIGTPSGPVGASSGFVQVDRDGDVYYDSLTVMAVTDVFPAGEHAFGIDCNEQAGTGIDFPQARVVAVALSSN